MDTYREARAEKNFALVDLIRAKFKGMNLNIKDSKVWHIVTGKQIGRAHV